jgi:hypothetical protein
LVLSIGEKDVDIRDIIIINMSEIIKNEKSFTICQKVNGILKLYHMSVRVLEQHMYIYVTNYFDSSTNLIHVVPTVYDGQLILRYVEVSQDFTTLIMPENDMVKIYDLYELLENNIIKCIGITNICLNNVNSDDMIVGCTVYCMNVFVMSDRLICVFDGDKQINRINISNNLTDTQQIVRFSSNGKYVLMCNPSAQMINIYNIMESDQMCKTIMVKNMNPIMLQTICVSDCGKFIIFLSGCMKKISIYSVKKRKMIYAESNLSVLFEKFVFQKQNIKLYAVNYDWLGSADQKGYDNVLAISGRYECLSSNGSHVLFFWLIRMTENDVEFVDGPTYNEIKRTDANCTFDNGITFLYKSSNNVQIYDLSKIMIMRFIKLLEKEMKNTLDISYDKLVRSQEIKHYHDDLTIISADETAYLYKLNNYTKFILSAKKNNNNNNQYILRVNANIDIYGKMKSFIIFQKLLSGELDQTEVVENIMLVPIEKGSNNIMSDLMDHMYEYIRIMVLGEKNGCSNLKNSHLAQESAHKPLYIGYILMSLILNYYYCLFKQLNKKTQNNEKLKLEELVKFDIIKSFIENFPVFKQFMYHCMQTLIGKET